MGQEIIRELVNGVWRTVRRQGGGGGGSQPFSGVVLTKTSNQVLSVGGSPVAVTWEAEEYDTDAYFTAPGDTVTFPDTAVYQVSGSIKGFDDTGVNGQIYAIIRYNPGNVFWMEAEARYDGTENEYALCFGRTGEFTAGDNFTLAAKFAPDSGGTTWQIDDTGTFLAVTKLGELP